MLDSPNSLLAIAAWQLPRESHSSSLTTPPLIHVESPERLFQLLEKEREGIVTPNQTDVPNGVLSSKGYYLMEKSKQMAINC